MLFKFSAHPKNRPKPAVSGSSPRTVQNRLLASILRTQAFSMNSGRVPWRRRAVKVRSFYYAIQCFYFDV